MSTVWDVRREDGSVRYLQSRVHWLPNHTADVQTQHILQQNRNGRELLEKLNLHSQQSMSAAHIVDFIGDHVNNKLHRNLQDHHKLDRLIESEEIDLATQTTRFLHSTNQHANSIPVQRSVTPFLKACRKNIQQIVVPLSDELA